MGSEGASDVAREEKANFARAERRAMRVLADASGEQQARPLLSSPSPSPNPKQARPLPLALALTLALPLAPALTLTRCSDPQLAAAVRVS